MAPRAKEPPAHLGMLESQKLAERIRSDLEAITTKLAEMDGRLSVVALDSLADPNAFEALEAEIAGERKRSRQLAAALIEAEKRVELELAEIRHRNERARCERIIKALAARDAIGAEVESLTIQLAERFRELCRAGSKAHDMFDGLLPMNTPGFLCGSGELDQALANQLWKCSATDIGSILNGRPGVIMPPPSLPGSQAMVRTGSPMPYTPAEAPSLTMRLSEATDFARSILHGERTFAGSREEIDRNAAVYPGVDPETVSHRKARERGALPAPRTAPAEDTGIVAAAKRLVEAVTGQSAKAGTTSPQLMPGEDEIAFAKRLAATPVAPISAAERKALTKSTGPTMTAEQAMAIVTSGRARHSYDESIDWPKKEDW